MDFPVRVSSLGPPEVRPLLAHTSTSFWGSDKAQVALHRVRKRKREELGPQTCLILDCFEVPNGLLPTKTWPFPSLSFFSWFLM